MNFFKSKSKIVSLNSFSDEKGYTVPLNIPQAQIVEQDSQRQAYIQESIDLLVSFFNKKVNEWYSQNAHYLEPFKRFVLDKHKGSNATEINQKTCDIIKNELENLGYQCHIENNCFSDFIVIYIGLPSYSSTIFDPDELEKD